MYKNIDTEIKELKSNLLKVYIEWKRKYNFNKYPEDFDHFIVFYSDGEYDPSFLEVINCLTGWVNED